MCSNRVMLKTTGWKVAKCELDGSQKALRGGSWNNDPRNVRSANRNHNHRDNRNQNLGLRLVLSFMGNISVRGHSLPREPKRLPELLQYLQLCVISSGELQGAQCVSRTRLDGLVAKAHWVTAYESEMYDA
jgi:hypothetical protein